MTICSGNGRAGVGVGVGGGGGTGVGTGVGSGVGSARVASFAGKRPAIHVRTGAGKMIPAINPASRPHPTSSSSVRQPGPLLFLPTDACSMNTTVYGCAAGLRNSISVSTTPISASGTR